MSEPTLFAAADLPEMATPVSEASQEWLEAQLLRLIEGVRHDPERLTSYVAAIPDGAAFLDWVIKRLGGRSQ